MFDLNAWNRINKYIVRLKKKQDQEEPIPMAPMIDMVFLLLVFFMTVSTVAQSVKNVTLDLADSDTALVPEDTSGRGVISIDAEGNYYIGETQVSLDVMQSRVERQLQENPSLKIQIRAAQEVEFSMIKRALKACAEVGAGNVIYATYQTRK